MKKILFLGLFIGLISCDVENYEISEVEIATVDVVTSIDGCVVYDLSFANEADITVRNFHDYIEVSVTKKGNKDFNNLSIHFTQNTQDFPKTGKGELNPSKFYYSENMDKGTDQFKVRFDFNELGIAVGDDVFIAAIAEFGSGKNKSEILATDEFLTSNHFYFTYTVEKFINYAGTDQVREIYLSDAKAVPSWDEVRKLYSGMLDNGVSKNAGRYTPSIWQIINDFGDPNRETQLDDYTTTYTLGEGDCSDSVQLTLRVVADPI